MSQVEIEGVLRTQTPQVLGALVRRFGHFDACEDATQEALLAAAVQWPTEGLPRQPRAWLITVASRRLTDLLRAEQARQRREETVTRWTLPAGQLSPSAEEVTTDSDDTLLLLYLCCHPTLSPASQIALTLRAVGGLSTSAIARAFLVPEATMTRRITRAKRLIKESGVPFAAPPAGTRDERLNAVLHVLYLIFNEGYAATSGPSLQRRDLAAEAIRLGRMLQRLLPDDGEVTGLLALMLLTEARAPARAGPAGELVPMDEQDRSQWDQVAIVEGVALITSALPRGPTGAYQLQAAIAAIHDEAPSAAATDWVQIEGLYGLLLQISDNPVVRLNHAVAVAMARGAPEGLRLLDDLERAGRLLLDHRLSAVRAHLLELTGDPVRARECFTHAAERATNVHVQRYLNGRAQRLAQD